MLRLTACQYRYLVVATARLVSHSCDIALPPQYRCCTLVCIARPETPAGDESAPGPRLHYVQHLRRAVRVRCRGRQDHRPLVRVVRGRCSRYVLSDCCITAVVREIVFPNMCSTNFVCHVFFEDVRCPPRRPPATRLKFRLPHFHISKIAAYQGGIWLRCKYFQYSTRLCTIATYLPLLPICR